MVDGNYAGATRAFSAAILLCVASTHGDALQLAMSDRWKPDDARRLEVSDLYVGRALAHINLQNFAEALQDAHAANFLAPNTHASLSLFAAAAAGMASLPQEPVSFFTEDGPMPGQSEQEAAALALQLTGQLAHSLAADAFSLLSEAQDVVPGSPQHTEALASRDAHAARSHGGLHPLADRDVTSRLSSDSA